MSEQTREHDESSEREAEVLAAVVASLGRVDALARERILRAIAVFYGHGELPSTNKFSPIHSPPAMTEPPLSEPKFSQDRTPSPKQFLADKRPKTEMERVICLAYYLTHYRQQAQFKTLDLSALNGEAGQPKLSNAAQVVDNAARAGYLLPTVKGQKQISMLGEVYAEHLPDQERARAAANEYRPKRKGR